MRVALLLVALAALVGCESDNAKCKKACDDVVAKEHGADSQALKDCKALCDEATK